uniref:Transmembrane protein n=1 Tax=Chromera velia CCMP2878 TaxID=1169474 RepID=A0A0G4FX36_9ALVE|eukprot:Cvel_19182.t1-p1 / transcript=Cvel_19182.t1 / gene=Cvel_19182 / organism=Chromera_velia_CCMP2878 / gene_product=hypothetical protein / transcript_product=hypothetical protein / location=Cvel_scaffold1636:202-2342(-) / protein_length=673 / sequence_SO=supercontig / SO=protein_coding / is_pseudo=false
MSADQNSEDALSRCLSRESLETALQVLHGSLNASRTALDIGLQCDGKCVSTPGRPDESHEKVWRRSREETAETDLSRDEGPVDGLVAQTRLSLWLSEPVSALPPGGTCPVSEKGKGASPLQPPVLPCEKACIDDIEGGVGLECAVKGERQEGHSGGQVGGDGRVSLVTLKEPGTKTSTTDAEYCFALCKVPGVCCGETKFYLDSTLQPKNFPALSLFWPYFLCASFTRCCPKELLRSFGFIWFLVFFFVVLLVLVVSASLDNIGDLEPGGWIDQGFYSFLGVFFGFVPVFQFPCLLLRPLSICDRFMSLAGFCLLLLVVAVFVAKIAVQQANPSKTDSHGRTPFLSLLFFLLSSLILPNANFIRRSLPRSYTANEMDVLREETSVFFCKPVSIELFATGGRRAAQTSQSVAREPGTSRVPPGSHDVTCKGRGCCAAQSKDRGEVQRDNEGKMEWRSGFHGIVSGLRQWVSTRVRQFIGPPHHRNKERIAFGIGVLLLVFDFLTDVYVGGTMLGLGSRKCWKVGEWETRYSWRQKDRRPTKCRQPEDEETFRQLLLFGNVVLCLAVLDVANLWLLRRDIRGPVSPSLPARLGLVRFVAFCLSLNELVIFGLPVVSFSEYRGTVFAVSIVSTLLGILWKFVQFLCICKLCKQKERSAKSESTEKTIVGRMPTDTN